jgi:predicted metalloprotease with PDZ domain
VHIRTALALVGFLLVYGSGNLLAQAPDANRDAVRYRLSFPAAATHYVEVEAVYPTEGRPRLDLMMPVWAPGSYLVREFSRHVEGITATTPDGKAQAILKTSKNHWSAQTGGARELVVRYRVYGREMGVRTNWIEARFALINGVATFITLADGMARPHRVEVRLPPDWKTAVSGLPAGPTPHSFVAADFDILVDSPIVAGNPGIHEFTVGGKRHLLVNTPDSPLWDADRAVADVRKIVEEYLRMWGDLPYQQYVFLNMLTEAGDGIEHLNSTVMMASRWTMRSPRRYQNWLSLVSHEYFHLWNVKRLRPVELGPFDYDQENYTRSLWIAEGITDYYGDLALRRAGLIGNQAYLNELSNLIGNLQDTPGRLVTPVEWASFDAWIRHYRPDENSPNVTISYYTKGAVVGFVLDAKIRRLTGGARGLDDVMRLAYRRYGGTRGYTPAEFRQVVNEVAGTDLDAWMTRALETTEEIDYTEALDWFGVEFAAGRERQPMGAMAWQGLRLRDDGGRLIVSQVRRGTPAFESGINVDDEIVAMDDYRVRANQWNSRVDMYEPGETVSVLVARRDELLRFPLKVAPAPLDEWRLRVRSNPTEAQQQRIRAWLEPEAGGQGPQASRP